MAMDVVDYRIEGGASQSVEVEHDPGEAVVGAGGRLACVGDGIGVGTAFDGGSADGGGASPPVGDRE